ncbi:ferredoxin:CoB-CoM heterodisulfide reductase subunit HdrB [Methanobrevibacter sp.]|uniref:ferredoxin:CoB-CoM heterodisulfide reductase subunit HdrB n=1 Tax=Methanobrevibacter sp. TaxID=66852 RepID=UPI00261D8968|nr:ferredoxin:CoB-CoM heterodisulfide reductase subunit HdrB [uncultured Methanobrevibacter sp.]
MDKIPDKNILLFKSCLVSTEYPGIESSTKYIFDKLNIDYIIDHEQSCCTGLGHYSDVFDQFSTTLIAARNFNLAKKINKKNIVAMCATCYAINKKSSEILNENDDLRDEINEIFNECGFDSYKKDSINTENNILHVVDILFDKRKEISKKIKLDLSNIKIATHHACHYCKVSYDNILDGSRNPILLDEIVKSCGIDTIGWYNEKRSTCGAGFRQRFVNKDLSLEVTEKKLLALNDQNVDILIHMCPNCHMQFDRYQPYISKKLNIELKTVHLNITQFIALILGADPYKIVGIQTHTIPIEPLIEKMNTDNNKSKVNDKIENSQNKISI